MRGTTTKTAERVALAQQMRAEGKLLREIAEHFGVSLKTIHDWVNDPDLARMAARKDSYSGVCEWCGGPTYGGDGAERAPKICHECSVWTPEAVIQAFQDFYARHGRTPRKSDEGESTGLPTSKPVKRLFGSWVTAQQLAGLPVYRDPRPTTYEAIVEALRRGERTDAIAARYGVTANAISMRLQYRGLTIRGIRRAAASTRTQGPA